MSILPPSEFFPPAEAADSSGVVGYGGTLSSPWLLDAYRHGIFPWPTGELGQPVPWCSPDPRAIFELDRFHVSRRLAQTCRSGRFEVTFDRAFPSVIRGCAACDGRQGHTWITNSVIRAFCELFDLGHAHSVEVWFEGALAGGTYGLAIGGLFAAESMFFQVRDASKVALVALRDRLVLQGYALWDIQQLTPHTSQFGAIEIRRSEYLWRLSEALRMNVVFNAPPAQVGLQIRPG